MTVDGIAQFRASKVVTYSNAVVADLASLTVSIGAGDLAVTPASGGGYVIEIELYGRGATEAEARANLDGLRESHKETDGLTLTTLVQRVTGTNHGSNVLVTIPASLYFELMDLETGSADIALGGFAGDRFEFDSGSGDQAVADVAATTLVSEAGSGDFTATKMATDSLSVERGSGEVSYTGTVGAVSIDSGSGDQVLDLRATRKAAWTFSAGSGEITIQARGGAYDVTASNGSGRIDIDIEDGEPVGEQDDDDQHVRSSGFSRASIQVTMEIETGSGNIEVTG